MQDLDHAVDKANRLAKTSEGKQLIETIRSIGSANIERALEAAASGDFSMLQQELNELLKTPAAKSLLEALERY